jgi:hypothetical protein
MERNDFMKTGLLTATALVFSPSIVKGTADQDKSQLDKKLVHEFVKKSHGNDDIVKEMLDEHPTLLNVAYDWNNGDYETGLGAASHIGDKELVHYFLDKGAQANIFTAALFGKMDIIKPMLSFSPQSLNAKGPHGFSLLHHANQGGADALEVKEYLISLGAKQTKYSLF